MGSIAGIAGSALLAFGLTSTVPPPPAAGAWHQLGAAVTSRPGKGLYFFRTAMSPQALGIVVTSSSSRPIHGTWSSWCEIADDDGPTEQLQGTLAGVKTVIAYPHVLSGATRCYVSVYTRAPTPTARTAGAEFSY
ncbi:MAG TPA: hypothetical protein VNY33_07770 [Gaiellaceae bacterium]|jgi:hypothetical protein|nr:hypothetical protein [Gaiellaceae bacterium]